MTGATGDLTPDDSAEPFVPAEWREVSDPEHQADLTVSQARHAEPSASSPSEAASGAAPRDDGYGSGHGLSSNDPAYRMESRPPGAHERPPRRREDDGDDFADHEGHF